MHEAEHHRQGQLMLLTSHESQEKPLLCTLQHDTCEALMAFEYDWLGKLNMGARFGEDEKDVFGLEQTTWV